MPKLRVHNLAMSVDGYVAGPDQARRAAALERAFDAAGGQDVRLGGGASVVQQYLQAGLVDEMHVAIVRDPEHHGRPGVGRRRPGRRRTHRHPCGEPGPRGPLGGVDPAERLAARPCVQHRQHPARRDSARLPRPTRRGRPNSRANGACPYMASGLVTANWNRHQGMSRSVPSRTSRSKIGRPALLSGLCLISKQRPAWRRGYDGECVTFASARRPRTTSGSVSAPARWRPGRTGHDGACGTRLSCCRRGWRWRSRGEWP